ncbi:hypothetical protein ACIQYS_09540 [Psychrobacillus sp. NPDC096426]|uniref:hypothetical protein n=1 Tax=Psychrobacillus sp. NPDC096426 TaxID=3364491 RepID=UPI003808F996
MGLKITGINNLKKLQRNLKELSNTSTVPMTTLLTDDFLLKNTKFNSFDEFDDQEIFSKYPTFEEIPDDEMDNFIIENSNFDSWQEMLDTAYGEYIKKKLSF